MKPVEKLRIELNKNKGVRIGHTAVVSRKIHTTNPKTPHIVNVIVNADAGKVFYDREKENEVIHIDLFHEIATFDVRVMADFLITSLSKYFLEDMLNNIDIQTGSGGGRLTGSLKYGKSETLRKSHLNHVHIAALISDEDLEKIFILIDKVEEALQRQGIGLRKIEQIKHNVGNQPLDLSDYASNTDSFIKRESQTQKKIFNEAAEMSVYFGSVREVERELRKLKNQTEASKKKDQTSSSDIINYLERNDYIERRNNRYVLTKEGELLSECIKLNRHELEIILKKAIKNSSKLRNANGIETIYFSKNKIYGKSRHKFLVPFSPEEWSEELDVAETVRKSMFRCYLEKQPFNVQQQDLVSIRRRPVIRQDICLLIDASASMAGFRLSNAKFLARHLVLKPYARVSILAFQENGITSFVPFTKRYDKVEEGLNKITARGLTPMALAINKGLEYMNKKDLSNPLIILITDGMPTVSQWTTDPISDAISAASKVKNSKIRFFCIGLQPNKEFLSKLVNAAKGKLFILDELERDMLVEVVRNNVYRS